MLWKKGFICLQGIVLLGQDEDLLLWYIIVFGCWCWGVVGFFCFLVGNQFIGNFYEQCFYVFFGFGVGQKVGVMCLFQDDQFFFRDQVFFVVNDFDQVIGQDFLNEFEVIFQVIGGLFFGQIEDINYGICVKEVGFWYFFLRYFFGNILKDK